MLYSRSLLVIYYIYSSVVLVSLSLLVSHPVISHSLQLHGLQHARLPCPSPSPRICPSSYSLHWWCYPAIFNSMDCSMPGFPVPHHLPEFAQVHIHCIGDAIQPSSTPWTAACQASLSLTISQNLPKFIFIALVMLSSHLVLWHPLLFLPSGFPSIRGFSNESSVHIRCLKYWSFSFNISPSSEYSGLLPLKIDWFDLLAV